MDAITLILLIVAILALSGAGYGYYNTRPAAGTVVETGPGPGITLLGIVGLILLIAFIVLLATGWRFGFEAQPPLR